MPDAKRRRLDVRATEETVIQAKDLSRQWGGIKALSMSDVVAESVKRAWESEKKGKKK